MIWKLIRTWFERKPTETPPAPPLPEPIRGLVEAGEAAYDRMYDARGSEVTACYSDAKEFFYEAIKVASELGMEEEARRLSDRLAHIKAVFRSQFS